MTEHGHSAGALFAFRINIASREKNGGSENYVAVLVGHTKQCGLDSEAVLTEVGRQITLRCPDDIVNGRALHRFANCFSKSTRTRRERPDNQVLEGVYVLRGSGIFHGLMRAGFRPLVHCTYL